LAVFAVAGRSWLGERALMDSARSVPPKMRMEWLYQHGRMEDRRLRTEDGPATADSGLVLRGKWGRGPAAEVTGKDTLVVLTLGSEVALLNFAKPDSPRVLSEIQFSSLTAQSYLEDSLLYTSSNADLEVWNVANPTQPVKRGELLGAVGDFWIRDTFLYFIRSDTFHVLSIANSANLRELGSCVESGSVTTGSGNTVVVCQSGGLAFVDVSNPASPHQVGTYACGRALTATARGNLVCASYAETGYPYTPHFITLDISTPSSPRLLANRSDLGGYDIFLDGPLAFVSGGDPGTEEPLPFQILSIADSSHPTFVDSLRTTIMYPWGVWENSSMNRALVADEYDGLAVVDISNLNNAVLDTWVLKTGSSVDVHVDGNICYVAGYVSGTRLLDVSNPEYPVCISGLDTLFTDASNYSVTARDSFAFVGWRNPYLRIVSVTDPLHPQMVAACSVRDWPQAMVLRDSLLYLAEDYKFQVVNVARPRAPVVVGTCYLPSSSHGMCLWDTLAFVSTNPLAIVSMANPAQPETVGSIPYALGVSVRDTLAYVGSTILAAPAFQVWNVANPVSPVAVDSIAVGGLVYSTVVVDSLAYLGCRDGLRLVNVSDPHDMRIIAWHSLPDIGYRLTYDSPYVYVATMDGGVCIFETTAVGITETPTPLDRKPGLRIGPCPARDWVDVIFTSPLTEPCRLRLFDVAGREVTLVKLVSGPSRERRTRISLRDMAPGLYFLRTGTEDWSGVLKIVKQ
jgi:hypothetical protein